MILLYCLITRKNEKVLLFLTWNIFILFALFAQNRFFYYFSINIAILSGIACGFILNYIGMWKNIKNINIWNIVSVMFLILIIAFLPQGSSPIEISTQTTQHGVKGEGFYEWHAALTWMRNNTPDPELDYYGTYKRPIGGEKYSYPEKAYGVMSWWDYGHIITYWAHRIPNANPFQSGIGGGDPNSPEYNPRPWGAAPFLVAPTEDEATNVLYKLGINGKVGAKYVVSNSYMAYSIQPIFAEWNLTNFGYFQQIRTSRGNQILPTEKYYNTMESKLHILDANGLKQYRLIHESTPNQYVRGGAEEIMYKTIYNKVIHPNDPPITEENSGFVKIFEYVKGANIVGKTIPNSSVEIKLVVETNIKRTILYKQNTISDKDGNYMFIVPYSTTGAIEGETQFDTKPVGNYEISVYNTVEGGKASIQIAKLDISERDVLDGRIVKI
jgi:dolichyl-diphosphooligosaccharide--protein glycosyltransferase